LFCDANSHADERMHIDCGSVPAALLLEQEEDDGLYFCIKYYDLSNNNKRSVRIGSCVSLEVLTETLNRNAETLGAQSHCPKSSQCKVFEANLIDN
jgi:hypothetical protein